VDASRSARNGREWHTLLEVCAVVGVLLIDQGAVYDPGSSDDRLLLGLKGEFSEMELRVLSERSQAAILQKVRRSELHLTISAGYVKTVDGFLRIDPDQRVQHAIRLIFAKFRELGSIRQTHSWFIDHQKKGSGLALYHIEHLSYHSSMARPLRIELSGALYHVTDRDDRREAIYEEDDDCQSFLETLAGAVERFNWICYAYCLMTNHYHLVIETPDANLSKGMRQLNGVFTQGTNRRHGRTGHLFQGRFKGILVDKDRYLLELTRYVVLNPVRANEQE